MRSTKPRTLTSKEKVRSLGQTVAKCGAILEVFCHSVLLLDEVLTPIKLEPIYPPPKILPPMCILRSPMPFLSPTSAIVVVAGGSGAAPSQVGAQLAPR